MMISLRDIEPTFGGFPLRTRLDELDADICIVGIPYVSPYPKRWEFSSAGAAAAIRRQSRRYANFDRYEFDFGGDLFADRSVRCVDCGDIVRGSEAFENYSRSATAAIRHVLDSGAVPIVLGGDHGTTIPVLRAYDGHGPLCVVQIDAHLDWLDRRDGVCDGYSSPMRRASEMPWVSSMVQIGLRGKGSARREEFNAAVSYGKSLMVGAELLHKDGIDRIVERIPQADRYYLTVDVDGLDPSIAPGVPVPAPGGVTYYQTLNLLRGLARKGRIVGIDFVEVVPELDVLDLTSALVARIALDFMGVLAHNGHVGKPGSGYEAPAGSGDVISRS